MATTSINPFLEELEMLRLMYTAATVLLIAIPTFCMAGSDIPDLKGTWVGKTHVAKHAK